MRKMIVKAATVLFFTAFVLSPSLSFAQSSGTMPILNAAGSVVNVPVDINGTSQTPHSVPEIAGARVSTSNPLPVSNTIQNATGFLTATSNTCGTTDGIIKTADSSRSYVMVEVIGAATIGIAFGQAANLAGTGASMLLSNGNSYPIAITWENNFVPTGDIHCIASSSATVSVQVH